MPAEERRRVFEPFYSRKPAGTGLGLTIARRIVASHGGRIQMESTPGCGACFTILLASADRTTMATILIVDDEPSARSTLGLLLRKRSHRVTEAEGSSGAWRRRTTVLIHGEVGSGQEVIAKSDHDHASARARASSPSTARRSPRRERPLLVRSGRARECPLDVAEELEEATRGTLLLDEIGEGPQAPVIFMVVACGARR